MTYNYDILLEYLSRKKSGSWQEFKTIVQNLNYYNSSEISNNEIRRMLSSLGHIEFLFNDNEQVYSITPPGIALFNNSFRGILCGYRTRELLEILKEECKKYSLFIEEIAQYSAPKAIFINFKNQQNLNCFLEKTSLNLYVTKSFSYRLLKHLPTIETVLNNIQENTFNLEINAPNVFLYDIFQKKKIPAKNRGIKDYNLYERQFYNKYEYFIFLNDNFYKIDKNYGECITYSQLNKKYLKYKNNKLEVSVVNLPELIDRALTLSSGLNRTNCQYSKYIYDNISLDFAKLVSEKTGLLLEI